MSATRHSVAASLGLIGVVASLGGLEAISTVVAGLPDTFPIPVLIVQHRRRNRCDGFTDILMRRTRLAVRLAENGMVVDGPGIVVIPGQTMAHIDRLHRLALSPSPDHDHLPGDHLLTSAAQVVPTIAVVLTGMLCDGTAGCREVKRLGGCVVVQDPATARATSMPAHAAASGCADFVLPLVRIPAALVALANSPDLRAVAVPPWIPLGA
ncbi:chemotaxis protein CheB [Skermania sp. ID1734]|uniref:chemotaxis protein CheB n=1 Tax=Skermania sp. ID1734 TaxID=2597516 RepID=UPI00117DD9C3|nr:chemotaxis protein CheB [Skermania sp. ID1734]TSD99914.1 chemotaxis protein CheB [Skermania sp. ID1734]